MTTSEDLSVAKSLSRKSTTVATPKMVKPFSKAPARKNNTKRRRTGRIKLLTELPEKRIIEQETEVRMNKTKKVTSKLSKK